MPFRLKKFILNLQPIIFLRLTEVKKLALVFILLVFLPDRPQAVVTVKNGITVGPVFNWSFGDRGTVFSMGANLAYWDYRPAIPFSILVGAEYAGRSEKLFYSELQTGQVLVGASLGGVYSTRHGFGGQASVWGNVYAGTNLRLRFFEDEIAFVPGLYLSIPFMRAEGNFE
jgi:hypothetical protein